MKKAFCLFVLCAAIWGSSAGNAYAADKKGATKSGGAGCCTKDECVGLSEGQCCGMNAVSGCCCQVGSGSSSSSSSSSGKSSKSKSSSHSSKKKK